MFSIRKGPVYTRDRATASSTELTIICSVTLFGARNCRDLGKRDRFVTFVEGPAEDPGGELLKAMSNIRKMASTWSNASDLRSTSDDLEVCADRSSGFFAANSARMRRWYHM